MKRPAVLAFEAALEEFQTYMKALRGQLSAGKITEDEYEKLPSLKAKELDL